MKSKLLKLILFTVLFFLFVVGWTFQLIDFISIIVTRTNSYAGWAYDLNIKIPASIYYFFCTFLLYTTVTTYIGYKVIRNAISLYKEYKEKRAQTKAERAEKAKQAKIKALESELEELKKG